MVIELGLDYVNPLEHVRALVREEFELDIFPLHFHGDQIFLQLELLSRLDRHLLNNVKMFA